MVEFGDTDEEGDSDVSEERAACADWKLTLHNSIAKSTEQGPGFDININKSPNLLLVVRKKMPKLKIRSLRPNTELH